MKRSLAALLMLLVVCFSATLHATAFDPESSNFLTETTIMNIEEALTVNDITVSTDIYVSNVGYTDMVEPTQLKSLIMADSIELSAYINKVQVLDAKVAAEHINGYHRWFEEPSVLGIC